MILADKLAADVFKQARVAGLRKGAGGSGGDARGDRLRASAQGHGGYDFDVPLLAGDHVTDDAGTGFVHTAPGHGREDFEIWTANARALEARGINPAIPYTVDENGAFTAHAPGFEGKRVINDKGEKGDANEAVIKALAEAGNIIARGRLKHQYPHSWRSKKPVIFRNTPQWFIAMDKPIKGLDGTLRGIALREIKATRWVPAAGENRITGMIESRPDWVISRQRAWGVPIAVFVREKADGSAEILQDDASQPAHRRRLRAGGRRRLVQGRRPRALPRLARQRRLEEGRRHLRRLVRLRLDARLRAGRPQAFPEPRRHQAQARRRARITVMYLEGSDQHRGWFHSSLLESCGTRGRAPFDVVLTHGFVLDEQGRKMSKSLGNVTAPQDVMKNSGADILRMWVCASDYADDLRIGPEILKTTIETYRKLRNTIRWMLGSLAHFRDEDRVALEKMPELERLMLHRLAELDELVRKAYADFDYKRIFAALSHFMTTDLSAFYFDVRKDALYCDPISSRTRKAALTVVDHLFRCTVTWLAPMLCFTAEEAWCERHGLRRRPRCIWSCSPTCRPSWRDDKLAEKWRKVRLVRRVVTGALEIARAGKRIGSSLEADPIVHVSNAGIVRGDARASIWPRSASLRPRRSSTAKARPTPSGCRTCRASRWSVNLAEGRKCARSWKISHDVGSRSAISRRHAARRAGAARMGNHAQGRGVNA